MIDEELIESFSDAVVFGELGKVIEMISETPKLINAQDKYGFTALHNVMCEEQMETISFLITNGANLNIKNDQGISPIHLACYVENAELLLNSGADINQLDNQGNAPLHNQTSNGEESQEVIEYLIAKGADKMLKNEDGQLPIDIAKMRSNTAIIELLN